MRFRTDDQRKAAFANMFKGGANKLSKVNSHSVINFEVKRNRNQSQTLNYEFKRVQQPTFGSKRKRVKKTIQLKPKVDVKSGHESCVSCKRRGLKLTSGECAHCIEEKAKFVQPKKPQRKRPRQRRTPLDPDLKDELEELFTDMERQGTHIWTGRYAPFYVEMHINNGDTVTEILFWDDTENRAIGTMSHEHERIHEGVDDRTKIRLRRAMNTIGRNLREYLGEDDD